MNENLKGIPMKEIENSWRVLGASYIFCPTSDDEISFLFSAPHKKIFSETLKV